MAPGKVNINGTWKDVAEVSAKVNGSWKTVTEGYNKVNGAWQQWLVGLGQPAMELIADVYNTNSTFSITNIPQTYSHLFILLSGRNTWGGSGSLRGLKYSNFTTNYFGVFLGNQTNGAGNLFSNQDGRFFWQQGENGNAGEPSHEYIWLPNYTSTTESPVTISSGFANKRDDLGYWKGLSSGGTSIEGQEAVTSITVDIGASGGYQVVKLYGVF